LSRISAAAVRVAVTFFAAAVALVGAEYAARFAFRHAHSSGNAGDFIAAQGGGPAIVLNRLGFREREIPPKNPHRYRVVVVGDSFTWGQGIEVSRRFSNLLEGFLGPRYEILNFGRPGNDMPEHLEVLEEALTVAPDFVLLQLYINDFETRQMQRPRPYPLLPSEADHDLERSSVLYDLMNRQWASVQATLGVVDSYPEYMARNLRDPDSPNSRLAFGMLRQFFERCRQARVACGAVLFPAPDAMGPNGSHYPFGYLHERVQATCASEQVHCLDLVPAFSTIPDPRSMWVSPFDAHPNAMANQRASREILQQFAPLWRR
jgi:lysophospholipase L1-like esterase